ncbi:RHS repeat-associated core domain-containing protein [Sandarakinorhabdus sp.]|uniref:RHS repeat-associated core domain-containing protein n=1 Tax=Sandarakinorhabdus sp. TaxID=1916663 RepID=UPI00286E9FDB|nr:RHS repeat-associated core domain-containing protein [Sandarakinorhabdus sp.]
MNAPNPLRSASGGVSAQYDPAGRLVELNQSASTRFLYQDDQMAAEIANPSGAVQRRYVWGDGPDELITWYEGAGTSDRRWAVADERGSVVAYTGASGAALAINSYDEYGIPAAGNIGRFQYTGQAWLSELGMYHYKARVYSPTLGRFLQSDPIGYGDGMNMYAYVGGDPVNMSDPTGKASWVTAGPITCVGQWSAVETNGYRDGFYFHAASCFAEPGPRETITRERSERAERIPDKKPEPCPAPNVVSLGAAADAFFGPGVGANLTLSVDLSQWTMALEFGLGPGVGFGAGLGGEFGFSQDALKSDFDVVQETNFMVGILGGSINHGSILGGQGKGAASIASDIVRPSHVRGSIGVGFDVNHTLEAKGTIATPSLNPAC